MGGASLILLDTHIWIWFNLDPARLPAEAAACFSDPVNEFALSAVSVWETVLAAQRGRIVVAASPEDNARQWLASSPVPVLPVDREIAILARTLRFEHQDPADRFIAATAYHHACALVTMDTRLSKLDWLKTIP